MAGNMHDSAENRNTTVKLKASFEGLQMGVEPERAVESPSPPAGLLLSGHFNESFGYHVHRSVGTRDWLLTYTLSGRGRICMNDHVALCERGNVAMICPDAPHDYMTPQGFTWEFLWAHFVPPAHAVRWLQLPEVAKGLLSLRITDQVIHDRIVKAFERLRYDELAFGAHREELAMNALEEVLILISHAYSQNVDRRMDPRIHTVLDLLSQRFMEPLKVADLARAVSLSPSRLAHLFKEQVGDSMMETLLKLRLRQASQLLELTSRSVGEIAAGVGFQSPLYFSRQFAAYFGISPTAYRKSVKQC